MFTLSEYLWVFLSLDMVDITKYLGNNNGHGMWYNDTTTGHVTKQNLKLHNEDTFITDDINPSCWHKSKLRKIFSWRINCIIIPNPLSNFDVFILIISIVNLRYQRGWHLGPVPISDKTSYRKISWSLEAERSVVQIITQLWNLTGTSAPLLPRCLSNFRAIGQF